MEIVKKSLWGLCFIIIGIIWGLNAFNITNIDFFFDGWWTLFIIVPCFIGLFDEKDKKGNFIGLVVGVILLLGAQGVLSFEVIRKLIVPVILISIGISILFSNVFTRKVKEKFKTINRNDLTSVVATFSEQKVNVLEKFDGVSIDAVFGSVDYDLRDAEILKESFISASAIFGGITIRVPSDVNVIVKSTSIFGGTNNKVKRKDSKKTIYVDSFCLFGGVDIK